MQEVIITLQLKKNIIFKDLSMELSKAFNKYFILNNKLKTMHEKNMFKLYTYSYLTPIEKDNLYKVGEIYSLNVRILKNALYNSLYESFTTIENDIFQVLALDTNEADEENTPIKYIKSITPAVITKEGGLNLLWNEFDKDFVIRKIESNAIKKCNELLNEKVMVYNFISDIELLNTNCSIVQNYKNGSKLIGNKYKITIKPDKESQKYAQIIFYAGMLEKNSLGFGYCGVVR